MSKKIALVTGNFKGLGKAICGRLSQSGFEEPMLIRSADFDLRKNSDCVNLIDFAISKYGKLDLLINNVGDYKTGYIDDCSVEDWQYMLDSNLNSAFYLSKAAIRYLRVSKGKIINLGLCGLGKLSPPPNLLAYQVAKTGLLTLTKAMAKAEAENGVTVNMVSPGSMDNTIEDASAMLERIPMKRFASFAEVVSAVEFILANDYVTGQNIEVAGGRAL